MGDPAGIGPEICIGTILERETYDVCRPFIIGSIAILEKAAKVLGKDLQYHKINDPSEASYEYGIIDVL